MRFPRIFVPMFVSVSRHQAADSGVNGKNAPAAGDVVLLIGNVPAGGGEVRTSPLNLSLQSEPAKPNRVAKRNRKLLHSSATLVLVI